MSRTPNGTPKPLCACGCSRRCARHDQEWATQACVPHAVRVRLAQQSRQTYSRNRQERLFRLELERLTLAGGDHFQRGDVLRAFAVVYQRAYQNGYHNADWKWRRRQTTAA